MLTANNPVVSGLLVPFVLRTFLVFGVLAIIVGIGLIISPQRMRRLFDSLNRWVSTTLFFQRAEVPRDADQVLTRHRYWFAAFVSIGSLYALFGLLAVFNLDAFLTLANAHQKYRAFAWGVQIFWWLLVLGNVLALVVGLMEAVAPAQLERLSRLSNRWISPRILAGETADRMHMGLDNWVGRFPRFSGAVIAAGALIVVFQFVRLMGNH
jgi:hypothetical protein